MTSQRTPKNALEKLQLSVRVTSKCRYNASIRVSQQNSFGFFTSTVLSLGLIFIPCIQNAGVKLQFNGNVLNMMQIFLGVSVLVYSLVIGAARYELRSSQLSACGDQLKELNRDINKEIETATADQILKSGITKFQDRYSKILAISENHKPNDYLLAMLEMENDYVFNTFEKNKNKTIAFFNKHFIHLVPATLLLLEALFITDMVGATNFFTPYLNK